MDYENISLEPKRSNNNNTLKRSKLFIAATILILILIIISLAMSGTALSKINNQEQTSKSIGRIPLRLFPNDELISGIMKVVTSRNLKSAWIETCVGSLTQYSIRFANMPYVNTSQRSSNETTYEIVSLVGTMTSINNGQHHIHISVGNNTGVTISGHLSQPSIIYTTAEIVIGYDCSFEFYRAVDGSTPWDELQIRYANWC
jgi:predicted DNA-binding protein with PD1-like motif